MPHANQNKKDARNRDKQWDKKRRASQAAKKNPDASATESNPQTDVRKWPIVRAYVPIDDVFRATGFGVAGIVRQQPNGKLKYTFFHISLRDDGIQTVLGAPDAIEPELEKLLKDIEDGIPPFEIGSPELAARYIWAAHAVNLITKHTFGPEMEQHLRMVPPINGSRGWWLQQLTGSQGLVDPGLIDFMADNPIPMDIPEDKEVLVWTRATFACRDIKAIRKELRRREPEFCDDGKDDDGVERFSWTREYPKNHWSPLSTMGGRQILGAVEIHANQIVAESKVLSMASILLGKLKRAFGDKIHLTDTQWLSSNDLLRQAPAKSGQEDR